MNVIPLASLFLPSFLPLLRPRERGKETGGGRGHLGRFQLSTWRDSSRKQPVSVSSSSSVSSNSTPRTNPQSPATTRLLLVGLPGGRYYPCGSFAMSFLSLGGWSTAWKTRGAYQIFSLRTIALSNYPLVVFPPLCHRFPPFARFVNVRKNAKQLTFISFRAIRVSFWHPLMSIPEDRE